MRSGIVNVLKPPGMTSHDVVSFVRRTYGLKKVGHAGTLDPAAAGVLPVFLGSATRLIEFTADADKAYRAELTFGYATDSGDDSGEVIAAREGFVTPPADEVAAVLASFAGESEQIPPMHSAIKIGGRKLYELARAGIAVERQPRSVTISAIGLVRVAAPTILFDVECSKGTYIRTLCADIGARIGCPAVMSFLVRTRVGDFTLAEAKSLEEIAADPDAALQPGDAAVRRLARVDLDDDEAARFTHGQSIPLASPATDGLLAVYRRTGDFLGIARHSPQAPLLVPVKVIGQTP
ncbi:tRNA pseudouridine(55) synthase TruB [Anaeroselena agilis]|uniref:tRNA pseudouridine synthase B n=1 Tax=Anaeroselena agilis TaxID=3063788 RepID=A0ABU3NX07_9FIRM|nr:tRNA pseudouridine(55) synthase TruB [Selenomonadales bacterium 4137-cl]